MSSGDLEKISSRNSVSKSDEKSPISDGVFAHEVGVDSSVDNAGGAPTEHLSPLGKQVGSFTVIGINISMMIGTGIFVTPGSILKSLGSPGASLMIWLIGVVITFSSLAVYNEFVAWYPVRSGSEVVYLEQAYPRPRFFAPVTFAFITVLLSFASSNCQVFAQYILTAAQVEITQWRQRGLAVGCITFVSIAVILSTKWSLRVSNVLASTKIIILTFIIIIGFVVLSGKTSVKDPHANFRNAFAGTSKNGNAWAEALIKVIFAFGGYSNANNLVNEIPNPVRTLKVYSNIALGVVSVLYVLAAVSFFAAVPKEKIASSNLLTAALFFEAVFGDKAATRVLPALVSISALGNILAVQIGQTRIIREVARQGVLPYPKFWSTVKPFSTPAGPVLLFWVLSIIVILAPPAKDAFTFIVDLESYPRQIFALAMTFGIWIIRRHRSNETPMYRAWNVAVVITVLASVFLLVMPWWPPAGGRYGGDVSFWYATYIVVGIGLIAACGIYYILWMIVIPRLFNYDYKVETLRLDDGTTLNRLKRVPRGSAGHLE